MEREGCRLGMGTHSLLSMARMSPTYQLAILSHSVLRHSDSLLCSSSRSRNVCASASRASRSSIPTAATAASTTRLFVSPNNAALAAARDDARPARLGQLRVDAPAGSRPTAAGSARRRPPLCLSADLAFWPFWHFAAAAAAAAAATVAALVWLALARYGRVMARACVSLCVYTVCCAWRRPAAEVGEGKRGREPNLTSVYGSVPGCLCAPACVCGAVVLLFSTGGVRTNSGYAWRKKRLAAGLRKRVQSTAGAVQKYYSTQSVYPRVPVRSTLLVTGE